MPRFDGTGPMGAGPRTGRGFGPCNGYGMGYGMGPRMGFASPINQQQALEAAKENLEAQLKVLDEELSAVKKESNK